MGADLVVLADLGFMLCLVQALRKVRQLPSFFSTLSLSHQPKRRRKSVPCDRRGFVIRAVESQSPSTSSVLSGGIAF